MNAKGRAEKVEKIEKLLEEHYFLEEHDAEIIVTDLMADAMHFAREHGIDPYKIIRMANYHFEEESTEDESVNNPCLRNKPSCAGRPGAGGRSSVSTAKWG